MNRHDEVPEPPATPVNRRGDLWIFGDHRLLCGDSTSAGRELSGIVDQVITMPSSSTASGRPA